MKKILLGTVGLVALGLAAPASAADLEYGFAPNWSAAVEYDHLFMGTQNYAFSSVVPLAGLNTRNDGTRQDADIVTARINYRWGGPVLAKY